MTDTRKLGNQNLGIARLIHPGEIDQILPISLSGLNVANTISRRVLANPQNFMPFDKISLDFRGSRFREMAPTKVRTMIGPGEKYVGVKVLAANEMLPGPRAHSILFLLDRKGQAAYVAFDAERITEIRTAASAAIGVETLVHQPYVAAILGIGPIGLATAYALATLQTRPVEIRFTAKSRLQFASVTERIHAYIADNLRDVAGLGIRLTPCEDIAAACKGANVIVDCTSAPKRRPVIGSAEIYAGENLLMIDVGKYALDATAVATFPHLLFDSLELADLPSPASDHCRERGLQGQELSQIMRSPEMVSGRVLYTVLGLPVIDTLLAEYIVERL